MFVTTDFIIQSNRIDPEYDESGILIAGDKPGDPMFDNQMRALNLLPALINLNPIPSNMLLAIHREVTRGISQYEDRGLSGSYRKCDVFIGGEKSPAPFIAVDIIENVLIPHIRELQGKEIVQKEALKEAWWCHDLFEVCHPFINGNGKCGRLLLNAVLDMLGHEKVTVWYEQRMLYYAKIQQFRTNTFPELLERRSAGT